MIRVTSSRLKARLGRYMRAVREGKAVVVTDRGEPVAELRPVRSPRPVGPVLVQPRDPAAPRLGDVEVRALAYRGTDSLALLRQDREER